MGGPKGRLFGVQLPLAITGTLKGWKVGIKQTVRSTREASYANGKHYRIAAKTDKVYQDASADDQWFKKPVALGDVSPASLTLYITDSPNWAWPQALEGQPLKKVEIADLFTYQVVIGGPDGVARGLLRQEWAFKATGDGGGATAVYEAGEQQLTDGKPIDQTKHPRIKDVREEVA